FQVWNSAQNLGWGYSGLTWSPIQGPAGNIEYLLWLNIESKLSLDLKAIAQITKLAQQEFNHSSSRI
ncbi:MAG: TlyA family rRNA (cytidine-2'-O)-methyltransferase, partial [Okeania sp. SIO2D1]|nr:TlyA family rRNA (cytidine-2'-O)-methyltransferase [Okeania sp. SIO2D1]